MPKRILIADDEQMVTGLLAKRLEGKGYFCDECWDGREAMEMAIRGNYDLLITDYAMPGMKGDEICEEIRSNQQIQKLPIIIVTAYLDKDIEFFKSAGANEVIYKPVEYEEFLDMVDRYLEPAS